MAPLDTRVRPGRFRRVLLAITNERESRAGVLAGLLIVFAILSAFYFPRRNPDFPGNRLGLFMLVTVVLFAGTMVGVVVFAARGGGAARATRRPRPEPARSRRRAPSRRRARPSEPAGDAAAGEAVFASAGLRRLPHARGRGGDRARRAEPRRGEAGRRARRRPGHERQGRDAVVQGAAQREADPGRRGLRRRVHAGLAARAPRIPCRPPGEVSERPKERDWKSRKRRKAFRGFKSRPLRRPKTPPRGVFGVFQLGSRPSVSARFRNS